MDIILAENYCPHLLYQTNISPKRLQKAIETIKEFFTEEYLEELKNRYAGPERYKMFKHPIYEGLLRGEVSVATPLVVELSSCLEGLRGKTSLSSIISQLKDPEKFDEYYYQLATAYRLQQIDQNMQMEPLVHGKTPDNVIVFKDRKCAIECTVMSGSSTYLKFHDAIQQLRSHVFMTTEKFTFPCNILFEATHESAANERKMDEMKTEISRLISLKLYSVKGGTDCCIIQILEPQNRPKGVLGMWQTIVPEAAVPQLSMTGESEYPAEYTAGFFVTYDKIKNSLHKELEDRIRDKIEKKRAQVKPLKEDHDIFLFIDTDISWQQLMDQKDKVGEEILKNFLSEDDDLFSMIVLTNRPRGEPQLFAINAAVHGRQDKIDHIWSKDFWDGFMSAAKNHNFFLKTTGRNDACPCGIGLKFKFCHGFYLT